MSLNMYITCTADNQPLLDTLLDLHCSLMILLVKVERWILCCYMPKQCLTQIMFMREILVNIEGCVCMQYTTKLVCTHYKY